MDHKDHHKTRIKTPTNGRIEAHEKAPRDANLRGHDQSLLGSDQYGSAYQKTVFS